MIFRKIDVIEDAMEWAETGKRKILEKFSVEHGTSDEHLKKAVVAGIKKGGQTEREREK